MKKSFFLGVLTGCVFCALLFTGYTKLINRVLKKNYVSAKVQQQIIQNIQDVNKLLLFADDSLAEYTNTLMEVREVLVKTDSKNYLNQEEKQKIISLSEKSLHIIEMAQFNTIPVFFNDSDGGYSRVIPVTLDAAEPSYKLTITCMKFNRNVIHAFIKNLTPETGLKNNIAELDEIISAVSLERAQLAAYQSRLTYSIETAAALSKHNLNERQTEIHRIIQEIKTELLVLSVQSANGTYCSEDREQIQLTFDELNTELHRVSGLPQNTIVKNSSVSLRTQSDAEKAMLYLAKKSN